MALGDSRKASGLTQQQLVDIIGRPQSMIARIENGNANVTFKTLNTIGTSLGKKLEIKFV